MAIQRRYRNIAQRSIASYDYTDIAEGTGVVKFYAYSSASSLAETYNLTTDSSINSRNIFSSLSGTPGNSYTYNFDLQAFNLSKVVKGTAIVNGLMTYHPGTNNQVYVKAQILKWDGSTETAISGQIQSQNNVGVESTFCIKLPLTETHFRKGEILRLKMVLYAIGSDVASLFHDPQGRVAGDFSTTATYSSTLRILMPFRLDL